MALEVGSIVARAGVKLDDDGLNRYEQRLKKARADARDDIVAHARVDADTRGLDRYSERVRRVNNDHDDLVRGTGRVRGAMGSLFIGGAGVAGAAIAFGVLGKAVTSATKGYEDHVKVVHQTNAVIKSTGGAAQVTTKHVTALADALERKTTVDGDVIQSGANMLLTFTNVRNEVGKGNDIFDRATKTAVDMSVALGTDASQSALQLGKALNDPVKGVSALQRVGVTFTKSQKEQIKGLVDHGKTLDAQKIILRELGKEFGGSAAASATATGRLTVAFHALQDTIGRAVLPYVDKAARALTGLVNGMQNGAGAGGRLSNALRTTGTFIRTAFGVAVEAAHRIVAGFNVIINDNRSRLVSIGKTVSDLARTFIGAFRQMAGIVSDTFGQGSGTSRDIRTIISRLLALVDVVLKVEAAIVKRTLPGIITAFRGMAQIVRGVIEVIAGLLTGDFGKAWDGVKRIFSGGLKAVAGLFRAQTAPIRAAAAAVGRAVAGAFSSAWHGIEGTATGFVNRIIDVINIIPGVNVKHVGGGGNTSGLGNPSAGQGGTGGIPEQKLQSGGKVTAPIAIMGEEAPEHPEWVIPTNPAYRKRAVSLWAMAAKELGIPGFALGGILDFAKGLPGRAVKSVKGLAGFIGDKLPSAPGGILHGMGDYALGKARDYIGLKVGGLFKSVTNALHPPSSGGGGGGGASTGGLVPQVLRALGFARGHGWGGSVTSGVRSRASQQALWDGAPGNGLIRGISVAAPGTSEHERGRAVDVTAWEKFRQVMGIAPPSDHLIWRGPTDPVHFSVSGHRMGGILGLLGGDLGGDYLGGGTYAYKRGGKKKARKPPPPVLSHKDNRGIVRSVNRASSGLPGFEDSIQRQERQYDQLNRRYDLTDEDFLIENDDGSTTVDAGQVNQRVTELKGLRAARVAIRTTIRAYRQRVKEAVAAYTKAVKRLQRALKAAKGSRRQKERGGYRQAISDYRSRISELNKTYSDLGLDLEDQDIDLAELDREVGEVQGTTGQAAPPVDAPAPDTTPPPDAPDTPDPVATPPSAEDIAAGVAAALSTFNASRADLFSQFGANFIGAGSTPSELARAAGARYFGGGTGGSDGGVLAAAGAGAGVVQNVHITLTDPNDAHTFTQTALHELQAAV